MLFIVDYIISLMRTEQLFISPSRLLHLPINYTYSSFCSKPPIFINCGRTWDIPFQAGWNGEHFTAASNWGSGAEEKFILWFGSLNFASFLFFFLIKISWFSHFVENRKERKGDRMKSSTISFVKNWDRAHWGLPNMPSFEGWNAIRFRAWNLKNLNKWQHLWKAAKRAGWK